MQPEAEKQQQREAEKRQREAEKRQRQAEKENETVKLSQMCAVDANKVAASQLGGHIFPPAVDPTTGRVCNPRTVFYSGNVTVLPENPRPERIVDLNLQNEPRLATISRRIIQRAEAWVASANQTGLNNPRFNGTV